MRSNVASRTAESNPPPPLPLPLCDAAPFSTTETGSCESEPEGVLGLEVEERRALVFKGILAKGVADKTTAVLENYSTADFGVNGPQLGTGTYTTDSADNMQPVLERVKAAVQHVRSKIDPLPTLIQRG
jgi:hypothetical protein